jgi:hypothetical protein
MRIAVASVVSPPPGSTFYPKRQQLFVSGTGSHAGPRHSALIRCPPLQSRPLLQSRDPRIWKNSARCSVRDYDLQDSLLPVKRRTLIATAWVFGATIPLVAATIFVFGCCVPPFHGVLDRTLPLCHLAADFMSGEHHDGDRAAQTPTPAREKQEAGKRLVTAVSESLRILLAREPRLITPSAVAGYRSFITLGAIRCDSDVGLHVLVVTFLI